MNLSNQYDLLKTITLQDVDKFSERLRTSLNEVDLSKFGLVALLHSLDTNKTLFGDIDLILTPSGKGNLTDCFREADNLIQEIGKKYDSSEYVMTAPDFCSQPYFYALSDQFNANKKQIKIHKIIFDNARDALSVTTNNFPEKVKNKLDVFYGSWKDFAEREVRKVPDALFYVAKSQADSSVALPEEFQYFNRIRMIEYLCKHNPQVFSKSDALNIPDDGTAKKVLYSFMRELEKAA